jgi:hypothetical protein
MTLSCSHIDLVSVAVLVELRLVKLWLGTDQTLCARQYYDNNSSQCKPRDFGLRPRGARRISRE